MPLDADPVRLAQVVGNLLNNAAKYTEHAGPHPADRRARGRPRRCCACATTASASPPDLLPRIFDLFVQADHAATRSQGGLGIGLTLVKNLVEHARRHGRRPQRGAGQRQRVRRTTAARRRWMATSRSEVRSPNLHRAVEFGTSPPGRR